MTTTDRSSTMPQDPTRPIVHAVDRLTAQVQRVADQLEDRPIDENAVAELAELRRALDPDETTYISETVDEQARLNAKIREEEATIDRVIDVIAKYEDMCLGGFTACQPLDVVRQLRAAVDGKPVPPGWEPGKPTTKES